MIKAIRFFRQKKWAPLRALLYTLCVAAAFVLQPLTAAELVYGISLCTVSPALLSAAAPRPPYVIAIDPGHGGMDTLMLKALFEAVREGKEMPIDVYDAAAWMVITCLSAESIAMGGAPVAIPDFTSGQWVMREPRDVVEF